MAEGNQEYWARRADEESVLAQHASASEAACVHRELAKAYRARSEMVVRPAIGRRH